MCRQAQIDYEKEIQHNMELHQAILSEKAKEKYSKHYNICKDVSGFGRVFNMFNSYIRMVIEFSYMNIKSLISVLVESYSFNLKCRFVRN